MSSIYGSMTHDVVEGMPQNGYMSPVRRFFSLFVIFDLLFTSLLWLICIVVTGRKVVDALDDQVMHYSLPTSMFDIVMLAAARFVFLILFYACLRIRHWSVVALTTAGSSGFLVFKVFKYQWLDGHAYTFEVVLILISFIISWCEAWFLDFLVIPKELHALGYLQYHSVPQVIERARLIRDHDNDERDRPALSPVSGSAGSRFYSPHASPEGSQVDADEARRLSRQLKGLQHSSQTNLLNDYSPHESPDGSQVDANEATRLSRQLKGLQHNSQTKLLNDNEVQDYINKAKDTLEIVFETALTPGRWKLERKTENDDCVYVQVLPKVGKIFKLEGIINAPISTIRQEIIHDCENVPNWNPTTLECHIIQVLNSNTDVMYSVAAEGAGGAVASRDFVDLRHWDFRGEWFVCCGVAVTHPAVSPNSKYVRGEGGPGCLAMRPVPNNDLINLEDGHKQEERKEREESCQCVWLLQMKLNGWLPQSLVDLAITGMMLDFVKHLRARIEVIKSNQPLSS